VSGFSFLRPTLPGSLGQEHRLPRSARAAKCDVLSKALQVAPALGKKDLPCVTSLNVLSANGGNSHMVIRKSVLLLCIIWLASGLTSPVDSEETADKNVVSSFLYGCRIGLLDHDVNGLWSGSSAEGGFDVNAEIVFKKPGFLLWRGNILPNLGVTLNNQGDTNTLYGGFIWEFVSKAGVFFNTGLGLAVHSGELETDDDQKKSLGSRVLFRIPIEIGATFGMCHRISFIFAHMSNAYLADPNQGLDVLGVRYGVQF
jgi:lipid A 3-O-deacylase